MFVLCPSIRQSDEDMTRPTQRTRVIQEKRVYVLDTRQKIHFYRLKPHKGEPTEWVAVPANNSVVVGIMVVEPKQSLEKKQTSARSPPSNRE